MRHVLVSLPVLANIEFSNHILLTNILRVMRYVLKVSTTTLATYMQKYLYQRLCKYFDIFVRLD